MKTVFGIFLNDIRGIKKSLILFVVIIGITILPALYAWFNIAANWDPYSNTGDLPFAVCSLDEGYDFKGLKVNAGDSIIDNLKANPQMGWTFVDEETAINGTKNGEYYAAVVIPKDFSENLMSLASGTFKKANLDYYVNEKVNSIAPKITDKGVEAIEQAVDSNFVDQLMQSVAKVMNTTDETLGSEKETILKKLKESLENAKNEVSGLMSSCELLITTLDSVDQLIESTREMEPTVKKAFSEIDEEADDVKGALDMVKNTSGQLVPTIESALNSIGNTDVANQLDQILEDTSGDADAVAAKLKKTESVFQKIILANNEVISILKSVNANLGVSGSKAITFLETANTKAQEAIDKIEDICGKIEKTGKVPAKAKAELDAITAEIDNAIAGAKSEFSSIKGSIGKKLDKNFTSLDGLADFAQTMTSGTKQLDTAFSDATKMNKNLKKVIENLNEYLSGVNKKIDEVIKKLDNPDELDSLESMILPIISNPEALGGFVSSPVNSTTHELFPVANYGSAMTPFYSSLALWVGGVVLVAVVSVDLSKRDKKKFENAGPTTVFFGRYMVFFLIGQIQALIIALGDLFFLKAQVENPYLFIIACMISSLVYTLFIYSITVTFSVIGKALAVIVLVLQVAGSGGTFPIEVLPNAFKTIAPYLPFRYGVPALRETVGGADTAQFWKYIGILLIFLIPSLIIGLLLRKPCMKIIAFFNKKIEESDLII